MAEDILQFQAGREAAIEGKPLDRRRSADWREGWNQVDSSERQYAKTLGSIAFARGAPAVPAGDPDLMDALKGKSVGGGLPILKSWSAGWAEASLAS